MVWALAVATIGSFVILVLQELRHWRNRPRVHWDISNDASIVLGTGADAKRWEIVTLHNAGFDKARIVSFDVKGGELRLSGPPVDGFAFAPPKTMTADSTVHLLVDVPDPDSAWVRIVWVSIHRGIWVVNWAPMRGVRSTLAEEAMEQVNRSRWQRIRRWWAKAPRHVGPGGIRAARGRGSKRGMGRRYQRCFEDPE